MSRNARSISSSILVAGFGNLVPPLAVLVIAPILAQSLGVVGRGELAAATAPYLLAISIATVGLPEAVTQTVAKYRGINARNALYVLGTLLAAGAISTAAIILVAPLLSSNGRPGLATLITLAGIATVPALVVAYLRGLASGFHAWRLVAFERIGSGGLKAGGVVVLALTGNLDAFTATICLAFAPVIAGLVYLWLPLISKLTVPLAGASDVKLRDVVSYGSRAWIGSIAGILLLRIDQVIMTPLSNASQLGLYSVAVNVSEVPLIVNSAVREVMFASDAREHDDERLTAAARVSFFLCILIGAGIGGTVWAWLPWLFGDDFSGAIPVALVLILAVVIGVPGSVAGSGLSARGKPEFRSFSMLIACVVNIVLVVILVPLIGAMGAAIAALVGNLVSSNGNLIFMHTKFGIPWFRFYKVNHSDLRLIWRLALRRQSEGRS